MQLRYHQNTISLLSDIPRFSEKNAAILAERERQLKIRLPASLVEWYSLEDGVRLLRDHSNADRPVPLEQLGEPVDEWYGDGSRDFVSQGLLWIMAENQGVSNWAVQLDSTDDPPVLVEFDSSPHEEWLEHTKSFSEFICCQIWDHQKSPGNCVACSAQEENLSQDDICLLQGMFRAGPITHGWPGMNNYRFTAPWGRILIWDSDTRDAGADWFVSADTEKNLELLLRAIWKCGNLAKSLYGTDVTSRQVLQTLRQT